MARGGVVTAFACAVVGFLASSFSLTALGPTLSINIVELAGARLFPTLMASMLSCLVLGKGLHTTANYMVTSTVIGPALIKMGVAPLGAHLFIFYFGIMADITPPVCMASITAACLASASSFRTGVWVFFGHPRLHNPLSLHLHPADHLGLGERLPYNPVFLGPRHLLPLLLFPRLAFGPHGTN